MQLQKDQSADCAWSIGNSAAQRISRFRSFNHVDFGKIHIARSLQSVSIIETRDTVVVRCICANGRFLHILPAFESITGGKELFAALTAAVRCGEEY